MTVKVIGERELSLALETIQALIEDPELITKRLDELMVKYAPVRTGYLKGSTFHRRNIAGASAPYAGWVEEMGHEFAYATEAIQKFNMRQYANEVVKPF
jgi:hypothetical protein